MISCDRSGSAPFLRGWLDRAMPSISAFLHVKTLLAGTHLRHTYELFACQSIVQILLARKNCEDMEASTSYIFDCAVLLGARRVRTTLKSSQALCRIGRAVFVCFRAIRSLAAVILRPPQQIGRWRTEMGFALTYKSCRIW